MAEQTDGRKAARPAPPAATAPAAADGITPVAADPAAERVAELERQLAAARAEADAARAELERAKAAPAGFATGPGKRFRVALQDGPTWVVEPAAGEHPFEAYKRETGVLNSVHAPEVAEVDPATPTGKA